MKRSAIVRALLTKHTDPLVPKVVTNGHSRRLLTWQELPISEQKLFNRECYSGPAFVRYRGTYYAESWFSHCIDHFVNSGGWELFLDIDDTTLLLKGDSWDCDKVIMGWVQTNGH